MNTTLESTAATPVRVWDLPLRLFHWSLLGAVLGLFVTAKLGAMQWHFYLGYAVLALLMFRLIWGIVGSQYARFASFPPHPMAAWRALRGEKSLNLGHNPLGAFSVYALLAALAFQAISGLFSNDDIAAEGPLVVKVSKALSDQITGLHKANEAVIVGLVLLHIGAIVYYRYVKKEPLIGAMIHGDKHAASGEPAKDDRSMRLRGLTVFALCAALVWFVVNKL